MSYTIELTKNQFNIIENAYKNSLLESDNKYIAYRFKINNSTITVYKTNKLLIQGKDDQEAYKEICNLLNIKFVETSTSNKPVIKCHSTIGSDEVGTGDFFGGVVVCACFVPENMEQEIIELGVTDSKLLTDEKICEIAPILMNKLQYSYRVLGNVKYNQLYRNNTNNMNLNKIKAIMHNFVLYNLVNKVTEKYDMIVIDAFASHDKYFSYLTEQENVLRNVKLIEKAEKLFTSVAAASCIARYIFLKDLERLENEFGYKLPKGASSLVDAAAHQIICEKGEAYLNNIAKLNFKNFEKAKKNS